MRLTLSSLLGRAAAVFLVAPLMAASIITTASAGQNVGVIPPGGKYKDCHGYIRHVSLENVRVHCIDGTPADLSFLSWPKVISAADGKTIQSKDLKPGTPVHVIFSQSLGLRHAYKVFVADPKGRGLYGFKT